MLFVRRSFLNGYTQRKMKFDAIIIGAGHSGLTKGIELCKAGKCCLAVCKGESSRRFREENYDWKKHCLEFEHCGGVLLRGSLVVRGDIENGLLQCIYIEGHGDEKFSAPVFYLSTGSFFSGGINATQTEIIEPIFGLDTLFSGTHENWVSPDFFADQPFMEFGVAIDSLGCALKDGQSIKNLFPIGSITAEL